MNVKQDESNENVNIHEKSGNIKLINKRTSIKNKTRSKLIQPNSEGQYKCNHCTYRSEKRERLLVHIPNNHGPKKYKCEICDFKSREKRQLKDHVEIKHLNVRHKCDQCEYKANYKNHLVKHKISQHGLDVKILCTKCEYFGKSRNEVKQHIEEIHKS